MTTGTGIVTTSFKLAATNLAPQGIADPPVGAQDGVDNVARTFRTDVLDVRRLASDAYLGMYGLGGHDWTGADVAMFQPDSSLTRRSASERRAADGRGRAGDGGPGNRLP